MALEARAIDLLQRFPDQVSEEEADELRGMATRDPNIAAIVAELESFDAVFERPAPPDDGDMSGDFALSELGRRRLDQALRDLLEGGAFSEPPEESSGSRGSLYVWAVVAAAVLLIGLGLLLRPTPTEVPTPPTPNEDQGRLTMRGDDDLVKADLVVLGPDGRLDTEASQSVSVPVRFQAVVSGSANLALLETQGGRTMMVWPAGEMQWTTEGGVSLLQPPGQSADYKPSGPGSAEYRLVVASGPIAVPDGPVDLNHLEALAKDARVSATFTLDWRTP